MNLWIVECGVIDFNIDCVHNAVIDCVGAGRVECIGYGTCECVVNPVECGVVYEACERVVDVEIGCVADNSVVGTADRVA